VFCHEISLIYVPLQLLIIMHYSSRPPLFSYVSFFDFLWAFTFIVPFSYFLWKRGTIILRIRQFLWKRGLIKQTDCDYEALCATLLLEQTQAIHYYAKTDEDSELNIAGFFFANVSLPPALSICFSAESCTTHSFSVSLC
jgi:hypothetical protein